LNMVGRLVQETELAHDLDASRGQARSIRRLAADTVRLWAEIFKGFQVSGVVHRIGASLRIVAEILEGELGDTACPSLVSTVFSYMVYVKSENI
jgi:hypothetical protein